MTRTMLKWVLLPTLLFAVALLLIRARPHHDADLRDLLLPTDCTAPCFAGIEPGVTLGEAARLRLLDHPAVAAVIEDTSTATGEWLPLRYIIQWRAGASTIIDTDKTGQLVLEFDPATGIYVVDHIQIPTRRPLADFLLVLGAPERVRTSSVSSRSADFAMLYITHSYHDTRLILNTATGCPLHRRDYHRLRGVTLRWQRPTDVPDNTRSQAHDLFRLPYC